MWPVLVLLLLASNTVDADDLRVDYTRHSLTGTHVHYQQYIDGIRVVGGERIESIGGDGTRDIVDRLARRSSSIAALAIAPRGGELVYLNVDGEAILASRVVVEEQLHRRYAYYYDAGSGALIRSDPLFRTSQGRVFDPNPVARLNRPDLQDQNNAAAAVPDSAYSLVELADLPSSGPLAGPNVQIVDTESPTTIRADASQSLIFDRGENQFEEVNAYFHIDRSQRYLQSLGYTGSRRIVGYSIPVDPHAASGTDNSFFVAGNTPGRGELFFGDGGTDDAEDSDIMLHEFGHAIQESIAPGAFGGSSSTQTRALGEGFGDYWAFSSNYEQTVPSGRDPFCIGDWDARCWTDDASQLCGYPAGSDCLRRVDGTKTMADFIANDTPGREHQNGEIWSSALREIFLSAGKRTTDTLVLEGTFGVPFSPSFALMAQKILEADRALYVGAHLPAICGAMTSRGIVAADCAEPRGEVTLFQSGEHGLTGTSITSTLTISDPRQIDRLNVNASLVGDGQLTLIAPDGTRASSTDAFRGRSAAGMWTLIVTSSQPVTLKSWSLAITFVGDTPWPSRPASAGGRKYIAAVAHTPGANGTMFITDVRLFNRGTSPAQITLILTPTAADGRTNFDAVKLVVAPMQIVALDDVVQATMLSAGTGQLELAGAADQVIATSRTYTPSAAGTYGQFVPSAEPTEAIASADSISIPGLENTADFRSNIGFAEVAGVSGEAHVRYYDATGAAVLDEVYGMAPYGHAQTRVNATGEALRAEVTVVGDARVLAYGSVVDNHSGDAVFIPAARIRSGYVPAIHSPGAFGTTWRTDVWVSNTTPFPASVDVNQRSVSVPARGSVVIRDVIGVDGQAVLLLSPPAGVLVISRTYTVSSNGTFGQFVPPTTTAIHRGDAAATLIGIESSPSFRTNIGLMAVAPATVRLIAWDARGSEVWRSDVAAEGLTQLPLPVSVAVGRVTAEVIDGGGAVIPYASVVDNHSGDPIYITAQY
jgi:hypothetical protein